jgi:hypothetical protein
MGGPRWRDAQRVARWIVKRGWTPPADLPADTPEPPPSTQRRVDVSDDDPSELRGVRLMREGIEANEANASADNPPVESLRGVDRRHPRFRCRRRGRTTRDGRAAPEARSTDET